MNKVDPKLIADYDAAAVALKTSCQRLGSSSPLQLRSGAEFDYGLAARRLMRAGGMYKIKRKYVKR